jgi:hypothetical protein
MHERRVIGSKIIANRPVIKIMFLMQPLPHRRAQRTVSLLATPVRFLKYKNILRMILISRPSHTWSQISQCVGVEEGGEGDPAFLDLEGESEIGWLIDVRCY